MAYSAGTGKFGFFISKDGIKNIKKTFGPQRDGNLSLALEMEVEPDNPLRAPFDCNIWMVGDPTTDWTSNPNGPWDQGGYLILELNSSKTLQQLTTSNLLSEIPTFIILKKADVNFRGLEEGYPGFLDEYLSIPPRDTLESSTLPGQLGLDIRAGRKELFFSANEEIGKTKGNSLSMIVLTSCQIRPHINLSSSNNLIWPEIERRNFMDPVVFWSALVKSGRDVFLTDNDYNDASYWFSSNTRTPKRIIVEIRDEHNTPLLENNQNAAKIMVRSNPLRFIRDSDPNNDTTDILVSNSMGGFLVLEGNQTDLIVESVRSVPPPIVSELDEQFVFWSFKPAISQVERIDLNGSNTIAPVHLVFQNLKPADWFASQNAVASNNLANHYPDAYSPLKRYTVGNTVTPLVDGVQYFKFLLQDVEAVDDNSSDRFIHIAGWSMDMEFELLPPPYSTESINFKHVIEPKLGQVRLLLWDNVTPPVPRHTFNNMPALNYVNGFAFGDPDSLTILPIIDSCKAILDNRQSLSLFSANHMKICTIKNSANNGLVGYCGGIDIQKDRVTDGLHRYSRLQGLEAPGQHDTMIRIEGEAAYELNKVLYKRWIDATVNNIPARTPNKAEFLSPSYQGNNDEGKTIVQIACTIDARPDPPYEFAVNGDTTLLSTLLAAIKNARQYIYIEDQYFRDPAIIVEIKKALEREVVVIVLMPAAMWDSVVPIIPEIPDEGPVPGTPKQQTAELRAAYPESFGVFYPMGNSGEIYVHSKLWIVDDVFVSCGSANIDRKGMGSSKGAATSCECNGFYIDEIVNQQGSRKLARDLRIRLWSEHLFESVIPPDRDVETTLFYEPLVDPISSYKNYWRGSGNEGRIRSLS